jgi:hypothetical protein
MTEFTKLEYSDHKKEEDETYREYFKRSFLLYKKFRVLIKGIIEMTNSLR